MKKILISADPYETRVAIVEDNVVVETYVERATKRSMLGNIYLGKVDNVLPGMEAAFIDAGLPKNCFLYVDEIVLPELDDRERRRKKIEQLIKPGQTLLVQITKDPMGMKGSRVSMDTSLAGRFLVYSPDGKGYGVSKRLPDGERDRLRDLVKELQPKTGGLIVRTAARGATLDELKRDMELLEAAWADIQKRSKKAKAPSLIHEEVDLALEMVRDDLRVEVDEVITDDAQTYERIRAYVEQHSPEFLPRIKLHSASTPLLRRYQVEDAIRSTLHRRVDLPSGGYLLIDYAEAFTIIDVNTGRFVGKSRLEDTILANNLEAAREVVRQLRLRDIGGMIVIDFIDMASQKNRDAVIGCLNEELKKDRSKVYLTSISPLGLVEMTRQNVTDGVREVLTTTCPTCAGEGRVLSRESTAIENLRTLRRHAALSSSEAYLVELHPEVAALMVGQGGKRLAELEASTGKHFSLVGVDGVPVERCAVTREGSAEEILAHALPVSVGQELEVLVDEPHMFQAADAVAFLDGGYRLVLAGAGPYLGEKHRVRIDRVGRQEAHASLLTATPVTEAEMLKLVDRRTDILEPERRPMERVDLEERDRRRRGNQKKKPVAKAPAASAAVAPVAAREEDDLEGDEERESSVEGAAGEGQSRSARRRRRRRVRADGEPIVGDAATPIAADEDDDEDDEDDDDVDGEEVAEGADGAPKRRRRGRRGGRRHRARSERSAASEDVPEVDVVATEPTEPAEAPAPASRGRARRAPAASAPPVEVAQPAAEEPPAPRSRARRAAPAVADAEPADAAAVTPAAKPARRRRAATPADAPDADAPAAAAPDASASPTAAPSPTAEPSPTPRRRRAPAAATASEPAGEATSEPAAAAPKPAAPRRRATPAPAVEAAVGEGAPPEPAAAPARPRARRRVAGPAADVTAPAEDPAPPAEDRAPSAETADPPPRRRRAGLIARIIGKPEA